MSTELKEEYNKPSLGDVLYYAQILPRVGVYNLCDIKVHFMIHILPELINEIKDVTFLIIQKSTKQFSRID